MIEFFKLLVVPIISGAIAALIIERKCNQNFNKMKPDIKKYINLVEEHKQNEEAAHWLENNIDTLKRSVANEISITEDDVEEYLGWIIINLRSREDIQFPKLKLDNLDNKKNYLKILRSINSNIRQLPGEQTLVDIVLKYVEEKIKKIN
jgi:hypothetical protein